MYKYVRVAAAAVAGLALSQAAQAADMPVKAAHPAAVYNWTGYYLGANAGYAWGRNSVDLTGDGPGNAGNDLISRTFDGVTSFDPIERSQSIKSNGAIGGLQFGYNWQLAPVWVAGLEADIQASGLKGDATTSSTFAGTINLTLNSEQKLKWFGTVRGRLGYLVNERLLAFGTGGLAYGETNVSSTFTNNGTAFGAGGSTTNIFCAGGGTVCVSGQDSKTSVGWTAGGGVEWAMTNNIAFKFEYLHVKLADQAVVLVVQAPATGNGTVTANFHNAFDIVRAGLNFRF